MHTYVSIYVLCPHICVFLLSVSVHVVCPMCLHMDPVHIPGPYMSACVAESRQLAMPTSMPQKVRSPLVLNKKGNRVCNQETLRSPQTANHEEHPSPQKP